MGPFDGVVVVDKDSGPTSHDVVDRLRRLFGIRKVGHAGTLDPLATGVLVVCLGRATRIIQFLPTSQKEYVVGIRLGVSTDTFDAEGRVTGPVQDVRADRAEILEVCGTLEGEIAQVPPMFSAVKVRGERLYKAARRGETVERPTRRVTIFRLRMEGYSPPDLSIRVTCSRGTYMRSLAHEIGQRLGCGGHVISLRRVRDGRFSIQDARKIVEIEDLAEHGRAAESVLGVGEALDSLPLARVTEEQSRRFRDGQRVGPVEMTSRARPTAEVLARVEGPDGDFCGVGTVIAGEELRPVRVFR